MASRDVGQSVLGRKALVHRQAGGISGREVNGLGADATRAPAARLSVRAAELELIAGLDNLPAKTQAHRMFDGKSNGWGRKDKVAASIECEALNQYPS